MESHGKRSFLQPQRGDCSVEYSFIVAESGENYTGKSIANFDKTYKDIEL